MSAKAEARLFLEAIDSARAQAAVTERPAQARAVVEAGRPTRMFSLMQRVGMRGVFPRRKAPLAGKAYVAGLALSAPQTMHATYSLFSGERREQLTLTLAEVDAGTPRPAVRVVHHVQWTGKLEETQLSTLVQVHLEPWRLSRVVVGMPSLASAAEHLARDSAPGDGRIEVTGIYGQRRAELCTKLLQAVDAGLVTVYAQDGSREATDFWAQVVRAQMRVRADGALEFPSGDAAGEDGYLLSLALTLEAARGLYLAALSA
jgi:hypothetical protein